MDKGLGGVGQEAGGLRILSGLHIGLFPKLTCDRSSDLLYVRLQVL